MERLLTPNRIDVFIVACQHRLLNGFWKSKMQLEMFAVLDQYNGTTLELFSRKLKAKIMLITRKSDESLLQDLKICCLVMKDICKKHEQRIKQTWVKELWTFVNQLLRSHYDYLILKNGVKDICSQSYRYKGLRQDLTNFRMEFDGFNFGIATYKVTREDFYHEVVKLLDLAFKLYKLKY